VGVVVETTGVMTLGTAVDGVAGGSTGGFTAGGLDDAGVEGAGGLCELEGATCVEGRGMRVMGVVTGALLTFVIGVIVPVGGGIRVTGVDAVRGGTVSKLAGPGVIFGTGGIGAACNPGLAAEDAGIVVIGVFGIVVIGVTGLAAGRDGVCSVAGVETGRAGGIRLAARMY
jgi:hypothetical protein